MNLEDRCGRLSKQPATYSKDEETMNPGTRVQYGDDGVVGVVIASDDPTIEPNHQQSARRHDPAYVYVRYDKPQGGGTYYWNPDLDGPAVPAERRPARGGWFSVDSLRKV